MAVAFQRQYSSGDTSIASAFPDPSLITYTSCYCEENVWKLIEGIQHRLPAAISNCYAVFISNRNKSIPLYKQKAAPTPDHPVVWDYHVILVQKRETGSLVFDFDTSLEWPEKFINYCTNTFRYPDEMLEPKWHRLIRLIPAKEYLHGFASDRSHMKKMDGNWMMPPPSYPCIRTRTSTNNISEFWSMNADEGIGSVLTLGQFVRTFASDLDVRLGQKTLWALPKCDFKNHHHKT